MQRIVEDYKPLIRKTDNKIECYVFFYNEKGELNKVEVDKIVFLQLFGVHKTKTINGEKKHFISYKDNFNICEIQVTYEEYKKFNSFRSQAIQEKNIYSRYIEQFEQNEINIHKRMLQYSYSVEKIVSKRMMKEEIYKAIRTLNDIQRKRFTLYYIYDYTYEEIALIEGCTKRAVKFSIDIAREKLKEKLKDLYLDYTNE